MLTPCIPGPLQTVTFAGSRNGSVAASIAAALIHCFFATGFSLITGCTPGIDACFRSVLGMSPFTEKSLIACAFAFRVRKFSAAGLPASLVVSDAPSPAAALHRRTAWAVTQSNLLVLFPRDPHSGRWGRGSTLAFSTAVRQIKPVFVAAPTPPPVSSEFHLTPDSLLGIVPGFQIIPAGGTYDA